MEFRVQGVELRLGYRVQGAVLWVRVRGWVWSVGIRV